MMAQAIGRNSGEVAYDRVVLSYLARVAQEMSRRKGGAEQQLAQRISKLIQALDSKTLQRLLESSADQAERREFVLNAAQILAADAVMEVVEAAAQVSNQTISHILLLGCSINWPDMPRPARRASGPPRGLAALRNNVARLIGDWELEDPNPDQYNAVLEGMVRRQSWRVREPRCAVVGCDPEIILPNMALELGCAGPAVYTAIEGLLFRRELVRIANCLNNAPRTELTDDLWRRIATPEQLARELAAEPMDQEAVRILVERIGTGAADALLDRLASSNDRSTRAALLRQLLALGPRVGEVAVSRLPGAPWFVQRNVLVLLGRLGSWPEGFSPSMYAESPDARIRREAIKLMLDSPQHHPEAVIRGLADSDEGIVALSLAGAVESCSAEALTLVHRIAVDTRRPTELRVLAVRILARSKSAEALAVLHGLALHRRRWFGRRLAPKSPELLAALRPRNALEKPSRGGGGPGAGAAPLGS